ncbi:MAG: hypothetical protein AMXMBFR82_06930 [Candidatus Hydrogenedentota bacterium]
MCINHNPLIYMTHKESLNRLRRLFPQLSDNGLEAAEENLRRFVEVAYKIVEESEYQNNQTK